MRVTDLNSLMEKLGYQFRDTAYLELALTHRSHPGEVDNERLEFLGDAVLSFLITDNLYRENPDSTEGNLSRYRSNLVNGDVLAAMAKEFSLGDYVILSRSEHRGGGHARDSILADAMEAVMGAVYLDGGIDVCRETLMRWYEKRMESAIISGPIRDPKTHLQEILQSHGLPLPEYVTARTSGKEHEMTFHVECHVKTKNIVGVGEGRSRRRAEMQAAEHVIQQLDLS